MSNFKVLIPSIWALEVYIESFFPTAFRFFKYNPKLFLNYNNELKIPNYLESKFEAQIEKVTNDTYLKVFQNNLFDTPVMPESQTTMNSSIKLYLEKENQNLTTGIEVYENLGIKHSDRYQYTLPYYDFSKNIT